MSGYPAIYGITAASLFSSVDLFFERLAAALDAGLGMLQVRDKDMDRARRLDFASKCVAMCHGHGCKVLVNGDCDLAAQAGADGVHVPSFDLQETGLEKPDGIVGVSCHDATELAVGLGDLDADFAVLSPVCATLTHVRARPMGWEVFSDLASQHDKPVYALGGLTMDDVSLAQSHGACGIASMRDVWGLPARAHDKVAA